ncbi:PstC family ABC transporter permease [Desulfogranum japonicum]|uniref:PstC family ABC transporter permease n=1 Tax=Desulfogranum japonicum TaxID=231447 RepID=UPI0004220BBD|nr:ABC transporter permease subunit [Desulfogranum japonicum]
MICRVSSTVEYIFLAAAVFVSLLTAAVFLFLLFFGLPLLQSGQLTELLFSSWSPGKGVYGLYPMLVTSTLLAVLSMLISFPISLGTSFLITSLAPLKIRQILMGAVRVMTGIPTVVYSFAALFLLVPIMRNIFGHGTGMSILTASPVLALVTAPTMILFFVSSLNKVPASYTLAADALGGSQVQKLLYVMVPQAWPGILNGTLLGFGRAIGDTMVSLMLAGNSPAYPDSITDPARTLTAHIALTMAYDFDSMEFKSIFVCGLSLYLITAILMLLFRLMTSHVSKNL